MQGKVAAMSDSAFTTLTPRERECLRGVRALMGSGQIARELGIATGTVDAYLATAKVKLGARDRKHAAMLFADHEAARDQPRDFAPQKFACENLGLATAGAAPPFDVAIGSDRSGGLLNDIVLDQRRFGGVPGRASWRDVIREIAEGARPSDLSMTTRGVLILAATVAIAFAFFVVSAGAGALYGLASLLKSLSH